jgi:uncharacterized protein (UPF0216 family)
MPPHLLDDRADSGYERLLKGWLTGEVRLVNSGLPRERRPLSELLAREQPSVPCADGSDQVFKRAELSFLAEILDEAEQDALLLPILIEMAGGESDAILLCPSDAELKVASTVIGMRLQYERPGRVRLYKPQLALLRSKLKTTTQYAFSARMDD